jgi:membrane peptidoglycan carboxypeptidase
MQAGDTMGKLFALCLVAGLIVAGIMFPAVGALGIMSNRLSDQVGGTVDLLMDADPPLMTTITDKDGTPIAYLYDQYRVIVGPEKISQPMKDAIVAVEDSRFYDHHGVDWMATARAALRNQAAGKVTQGASTLTQQYVKNYLIHVLGRTDKDSQAEAQEQTLVRKLRETRIAIQLEQEFSKDEIMARYLNTVPFGSTIYGVAAAAQAYFQTTSDKLTVPQAAMLAGMVNSPSALDPEARPDKAL